MRFSVSCLSRAQMMPLVLILKQSLKERSLHHAYTVCCAFFLFCLIYAVLDFSLCMRAMLLGRQSEGDRDVASPPAPHAPRSYPRFAQGGLSSYCLVLLLTAFFKHQARRPHHSDPLSILLPSVFLTILCHGPSSFLFPLACQLSAVV